MFALVFINGFHPMPSNFTSGWLGNNKEAWHGQGVVTEGTLSPRDAFETAGALFDVEKRAEFFHITEDLPGGDSRILTQPNGRYSIVRTDTQTFLGSVSESYEIVQNSALLRMAEFIREEADMDSVVVLADGGKVAFTATIKGAAEDIVPGDRVARNIVGFLGHDGRTGCGAMFTDVRVVCQNTLALAMRDNKAMRTIHHNTGANDNFDALIRNIDASRRNFGEQMDLMKEFSKYKLERGYQLDDYFHKVYDLAEDADVTQMRKYMPLQRAYWGGLGSEFHRGTLWGAVNAVTELETSTSSQLNTAKQSIKKFSRANFGEGQTLSRRAIEVAKELISC